METRGQYDASLFLNIVNPSVVKHTKVTGSMARPLQVLSLLSRFGALSVVSPAHIRGCRFASRGASKAWTGQSHVYRDTVSKRASRHSDDMYDEEDALDDVEDKLQALVE